MWTKLAEILLEMKDYSEALAAAEVCSVCVLIRIISCFSKKGRVCMSLTHSYSTQRALTLNPADSTARVHLSVLYKRLNHLDKYEEMLSYLCTVYASDKAVLEQVADVRYVKADVL